MTGGDDENTFLTQAPLQTFDSSSESTSETLREATESIDSVTVEPVQSIDAELPDRYEVLDLLGEGGMGSVLRVRDLELNRTVAMKVLKPRLLSSDNALMRFKEEAQIAAQLQHPGIIPVHGIGRRPDGALFFTMKEVKGKTWEDVIDDVQVALESGLQRTEEGWSFRRLIDIFHRVCETVAYAHHRGVAHRDLKPENVMVGAFGEVLVLDWGLAKILAEEVVDQLEGGVVTSRSMNDSVQTRMGAVAGTPSYMAPEQARGQIHKITPATDVYGLGGILYAILTGRTPYLAPKVRDLLDMVAEGSPIVEPVDVEEVPGPVPPELSDIAMKALSFRQEDRYTDAGDLAEEIAAWLDGARKREKALEIVAEGEAKGDRIPSLLAEATRQEAEAERLLAGLAEGAVLEDHHPAWACEARASAARSEAVQLELEVLQGLRGALTHAPDLPEAHRGLAERFHAAHVKAELDGDQHEAQQFEMQLRAHDLRGKFANYLRGDGALTLVTEPLGAAVALYEYVEQHKRLVPVFRRDLGHTPILEVPLERGRWMLKITAPGHHDVIYPVTIARLQHWDGIPPGKVEPFPIVLPKLGELADDDCYVPAGYFWTGRPDPATQNPIPREWIWCHAMVFKKFPVTMAEMARCAQGYLDRVGEIPDDLMPKFLGHGLLDVNEGRVSVGFDSDGDPVDPEWAVFGIPYDGAQAYLSWLTDLTEREWRLPHELEWIKAAAGVDERPFPWGWSEEAKLAANATAGPNRVTSHPGDVSPSGVRQIVGGVFELARDPAPAGSRAIDGYVQPVELVPNDEMSTIACGGCWGGSLLNGRITRRKSHRMRRRSADVGFRCCSAFLPPR